MYAEKLIIEFLDTDGTMQTSIIEHEGGENLLVDYAFRKKTTGQFASPFLILSDNQEQVKKKLVPQTQLSPRDFIEITPNEFAFRQEWINIQFKAPFSLGLYALGLPRYANIINLEVRDPYNPDHNLRRNVIKDLDDRRYFLFTELRSENRTVSFEIRCKFAVNKRIFLTQTFTDSKYEMFGTAIEKSAFREFANVMPQKTVAIQDNRQYNFQSATIGQLATGDNNVINNEFNNAQFFSNKELSLAIEKLIQTLHETEEVSYSRKREVKDPLEKLSKEVSKPNDEQDKSFVKYAWTQVMTILKDVSVVAGLLQTISKLLGA